MSDGAEEAMDALCGRWMVESLPKEHGQAIRAALELESKSAGDRDSIHGRLYRLVDDYRDAKNNYDGFGMAEYPSVHCRKVKAIESASRRLRNLVFGAQSSNFMRAEISQHMMGGGASELASLRSMLDDLDFALSQAAKEWKAKDGDRGNSVERDCLWEPLIELYQDINGHAGETENGPVFRLVSAVHAVLEMTPPPGSTLREVIEHMNRKRGSACEICKDSIVVESVKQ